MHVGEKIPFCSQNQKKKEGGDEEPEKKNKKISYHTVYPSVNNFIKFFKNLYYLFKK